MNTQQSYNLVEIVQAVDSSRRPYDLQHPLENSSRLRNLVANWQLGSILSNKLRPKSSAWMSDTSC